MSNIDKQWLQQKIAAMEATRDEIPFGLDEDDSNTLAALRIALASLEAKSKLSNFIATQESLGVAFERVLAENLHDLYVDCDNSKPAPKSEAVYQVCKEAGIWVDIESDNIFSLQLNGEQVRTLFTAPPAPVSVPECFKRLLHHAYGMTMGHDWNKGTMAGHHRDKLCLAVEDCRAAMLQGAENAESTNTMQTAPALDSSPKIAESTSGINQGKSEPVTTAYKLPDDFDFDRFNDVVWLEAVASNPHMHSPTTSTIAMVALELNRKLAAGNSLVIPEGWVACSDRMPKKGEEVLCTDQFENYETALYDTGYIPGPPFFATTAGEFHPTHWMPLPAAPKQGSINGKN